MNFKSVFSRLIQKTMLLPCVQYSQIHKTARIKASSNIYKCTMGKYSYVGEHTNMSCAEVGSFTSISQFCAIGGGSHPIDTVSTSPVFCEGKNFLGKNFAHYRFMTHKTTVIGSDVWIGAKALVKSGVTIGDGAVVGMGSVVTKDIGPYEIWVGNPARLIRKRFDDETIDKLLNMRWWDLDDTEIEKYGELFNSPEKLIEEYFN